MSSEKVNYGGVDNTPETPETEEPTVVEDSTLQETAEEVEETVEPEEVEPIADITISDKAANSAVSPGISGKTFYNGPCELCDKHVLNGEVIDGRVLCRNCKGSF